MLYHLEDIEKIRSYEKILRDLGNNVFDISHWDSGDEYNKKILSKLEIKNDFEPCDYIYSYEINERTHSQLRKNLIGENNKCSIIFANSTVAILNLCNFIQKKGLQKVCLLQPSYFTIKPCMHSFGLNVNEISLNYNKGNYEIPIERILSTKCDAVWLTSPVFCTSTYFEQQEIDKLQQLLDKGIYVFCDESLSIKGKNIHSRLTNNEKLFSLYSPHKVISTNAFKFACIICDQNNEMFFDQWTDIFAGGLMNSSRLAISHFLSNNYLECLDVYIHHTSETKKIINNYIDSVYSGSNIYISHEIGQYMTIYYPNVPFIQSTKSDFIKHLIMQTGVSLLPGYLEGFNENLGFCFRINLTLDKTYLLSGLNSVLQYLNKYYS